MELADLLMDDLPPLSAPSAPSAIMPTTTLPPCPVFFCHDAPSFIGPFAFIDLPAPFPSLSVSSCALKRPRFLISALQSLHLRVPSSMERIIRTRNGWVRCVGILKLAGLSKSQRHRFVSWFKIAYSKAFLQSASKLTSTQSGSVQPIDVDDEALKEKLEEKYIVRRGKSFLRGEWRPVWVAKVWAQILGLEDALSGVLADDAFENASIIQVAFHSLVVDQDQTVAVIDDDVDEHDENDEHLIQIPSAGSNGCTNVMDTPRTMRVHDETDDSEYEPEDNQQLRPDENVKIDASLKRLDSTQPIILIVQKSCCCCNECQLSTHVSSSQVDRLPPWLQLAIEQTRNELNHE